MADLGTTFRLPPREAYARAKAAAVKAVELDDTLAEAHTSLAQVVMNYELDWPTVEREFKRTQALSPNSAPALHFYSHYLVLMGRFDESLAVSLRALGLDPLDIGMNLHLGFHYYNARQPAQAVAQLQKTLAMSPGHPEAHGILGLAYAQQGRYDEALTELKKGVELGGADARGNLGYVAAVAGRRDEAQTLLAQLLDEANRKPVSPYNIALIYAGLGEREPAFAWLERAVAERDSNCNYPGLKVAPQLDGLRGDPRFTALLRCTGLTP